MDFFTDTLVFLVVLAELIFFHELGHFVAAKLCGVYCDRFSIGMPPRLFGVRIGETDYCLGALPIGGYVKMVGQEDVPMSEEEREKEYGHVPPERWLTNRPRWQRAIVFAAGPLMNLVLAVVLYALVAGIGAEVPESKLDTRIGYVEPESPAAEAPLYQLVGSGTEVPADAEPASVGWQTGDRVVSIDGRGIDNFNDIAFEAAASEGRRLRAILERKHDDGATVRYLSHITPKRLSGGQHARFGVEPFRTALVNRVLEDGPASRSGIKAGDIIIRAGGRWVDAASFTKMMDEGVAGEPLALELQRGQETVVVQVTPEKTGDFSGVSFWPPPNWVAHFQEGAPLDIVYEGAGVLDGMGLRAGDVIQSIDGEDASLSLLWQLQHSGPDGELPVKIARGGETLDTALTIPQMVQALTAYNADAPPEVVMVTPEAEEVTGLQRKDIIKEADGRPATAATLLELQESRVGDTVTLEVERPAILFGFIQQAEQLTVKAPIESVSRVGVAWGTKMVFHRVPLLRVIPTAIGRAFGDLFKTLYTLVLLLTGGLSPKDIGGPVMIYQVTTEAARAGYSYLLEMTAFISVNLCVFNLLPMPVLDGGHLLLLGIEGIRRKPVDVRVVERFQQVGLLLIVFLFLFITFNDFKRIFTFMIP